MASLSLGVQFLLALALLSFALAAASDEPIEATLRADDECQADSQLGQGDSACSLNALQMKSRKVEEPPADTVNKSQVEEPPADAVNKSQGIMPVAKGDATGVPVKDLGADELDRMQAQAEEEREEREIENQLFPPEAPGTNESVDASAEVSLAWSCSARAWRGGGGSERCFCQLAQNAGCSNTGCSCPQGCLGITWSHPATVTFKNKARAHGCSPSTVLLTSPRSYFKDTNDLKSASGGSCMVGILTQMMIDSWSTYQRTVASKPVWQCFHSPRIASVGYLHIQTFCAEGNFHGMPSWNPNVAYCVRMTSASQAVAKAHEMAHKLR